MNPFFELTYTHSYFPQEKEVEVFAIRPDPETQQLLQDYGILFQTTTKGFRLFLLSEVFGNSAQAAEQTTTQTEVLSLSFELYPHDPHFYQYSDVNLTLGEQIYQYTLDAETAFSTGSEPISLTETVEALDDHKGSPPFARLILQSKPFALGESPSFGEAKQAHVEIESRVVFWEYRIALQSGTQTGETYKIQMNDPNGNFSFTGVTEKDAELAGSSTTAIALHQEPKQGIELQRELPSAGGLPPETETLISNLPNPKLEKVYQYTVGETRAGDYYALIQVKL